MGESKKDASQLREVHHLLMQGKSAEAHIRLTQIADEPPAQRKEFDYLQAWNALLQERWEDVTQQIRDIPALLRAEERESLLTNGSIRRRRPVCLLILGEMARELGYPEEATEHLQHCLALLNERRMNIPEVRLLAHCNLGQLALEMNQTAQALIQYETASGLCGAEEAEHVLFTTILTGLCETFTRLGRFEQALSTGKQALRLLRTNPSSGCQEPLLLMLSRVSLSLEDTASALAYAQDARHVANQANDPARVANSLLVLAEVQYKARQMQEARTNCQHTLALLSTPQDQPLRATTLFLSGKIAEAEWHHQPEQEKLATEALECYEQARASFDALHDASALAKVSRRLAQLLEDRGQPELALTHWKNAYMLSEQRG
jgi:tetratricopeptide (TPR) repeat protein